MNRAIKYVETPYTIFSDANTLLNAGSCSRNHETLCRSPCGRGGRGEKNHIRKTIRQPVPGKAFTGNMSLFLKKLDSDFYSVVGAAGELFSVKTDLFHEAAEDTIIEDFVQSLQICMEGYVIRYEPSAFAVETASASMREEQKRKIRIAAGAFQAMVILKGLFNLFRYPVLSFQFISHRILKMDLMSPLPVHFVCFECLPGLPGHTDVYTR